MVGRYIQSEAIWERVENHVKIPQKTKVHPPIDKIKDAFINILSGGKGITEINTRVRPDESLHCAFRRQGCAEKSVVSITLNRSTEITIVQMREALKEIFQVHSQAIRHNYKKNRILVDVDMTGMPAGGQGEEASPKLQEKADGIIHIPMPSERESLNAAVARSVILLNIVRQSKI